MSLFKESYELLRKSTPETRQSATQIFAHFLETVDWNGPGNLKYPLQVAYDSLPDEHQAVKYILIAAHDKISRLEAELEKNTRRNFEERQNSILESYVLGAKPIKIDTGIPTEKRGVTKM